MPPDAFPRPPNRDDGLGRFAGSDGGVGTIWAAGGAETGEPCKRPSIESLSCTATTPFAAEVKAAGVGESCDARGAYKEAVCTSAAYGSRERAIPVLPGKRGISGDKGAPVADRIGTASEPVAATGADTGTPEAMGAVAWLAMPALL